MIEHIFPQNPNSDWNKDVSPEDYFSFKEKYVNTIANLTLSGNNGALSNKSFKDKKEMNISGGEQGYKYSRLWLNTYLNSIQEWNISNYEERFNLIYSRFLNIWAFPDVIVPENESSSEVNIFDADSPTSKKLEYFIFEDTKIEESAVAMMYQHVINSLFQKNAQLLLENQEILKMTRNPEDFRAAGEIANGYYIEYNIDSKTKFGILKKLLTIFELEEELIIKYSDDENEDNPSRFSIRREYWKQLLPLIKGTILFSKVSPSKDHWLSAGAGTSGVNYSFVITRNYARIELALIASTKEINKRYYKILEKHKQEIENRFGSPLEWEELPDNKMSRIKYQLDGVNIFNQEDWPTINNFFVDFLPKFESAFKPTIHLLR